jgi:hypothetical protein
MVAVPFVAFSQWMICSPLFDRRNVGRDSFLRYPTDTHLCDDELHSFAGHWVFSPLSASKFRGDMLAAFN